MVNKATVYNVGDPGSIPGLGRSPGEGNGNPLQYSCLENPMDRGAWWAIVHGVTKSQTRLSDFTFTFSTCSKQALGLLLVALWGLLIVVASHCGGFSPAAQGFWPMCSIVMACVLSCFAACGIFPDPGSNQCSLHCITTGPPGKSELWILKTLLLQVSPTIKYTHTHTKA